MYQGDEMISSITVSDLLNFSGLNIIDVRTEQSYNNNHIPGAVNVPFNKLIAEPYNCNNSSNEKGK